MISTSNIQNKTSFFGVVIMLTLFLTILGVIYIAYTSIHKELQNVLAVKEKHIEQMQQLQTDMQGLQESVASGGKSALFSQLEAKVASLELQVTELKEQVISQKPTLATVSNDSGLEYKGVKTNESASDILVSTEESKTNNNSLITEAILDRKLKRYTQQLENKIDRKLEVILQHLTQNDDANKVNALNKTLSKDKVSSSKNLDIETPTVNDVDAPEVKEPIVKLVSRVKAPSAPLTPDAPVANASEDVKWLISQPKPYYILQLASMPDTASLTKLIDSKKLKGTKIIPQTRNDLTNYVLVTDALANKAEAYKLAKKIKSESGISPWVRKVQDLTKRIQ